MIDPKVITLLKVYETKNFTKAAQQLALTQPAVSKHIRMLQEELGIKIFLRSGNELIVTREGELAVKYAKRMVSLTNNLRDELADQKMQLSSLSVGITHTAESNASTEALANYATGHEKVKLRIVTDTMESLCSMLKNYELDMAIIEGRVSDPKLKSVLLDTDCLVLALSTTNPLAGKPSVSIEDLKKENLILRSSGSGTMNMFASSLEARGLHLKEFNVLMEIDNIATIKDLIRRNFGVSVLARSACMDEYYKNKIALLPIENLSMIREINLVCRKDFEYQELIKDIVHSYNETVSAEKNRR